MRSAIFLILTLVSMSTFGDNMEEAISIEKIENQYSISYFNYKPDVLAYFENAGLQGGGYTWESLVKAAISTELPSALKDIEFDSEGDAFFAYTGREATADKVKAIIEKLSSDITYREKILKVAESDGDIE